MYHLYLIMCNGGVQINDLYRETVTSRVGGTVLQRFSISGISSYLFSFLLS